ncbi:PTS sugar transporter subunit IIA [Candidatus Stoquefichus massiliensis]|uniref:PTS sugar transporter subunit IIA n=1 Tax=Candidatus Stoquefichus massiliensis TaxID=1470350 RepID=UPI000486B1CB|nr:hypothetical protein [Candidatus Stoquefichus massiliensis]
MEKDKKIIIATHGELARGFVSALNIIVGDTSRIETICGYLTPDFNLADEIEKIMTSVDFDTTDVIVCTDMMGGSVNNEFVKHLSQYPFYLVTNTNLAFLVDLVLTPGEINTEILNAKVSDEMVSVKYVNSLVNHYEDDLDDSL